MAFSPMSNPPGPRDPVLLDRAVPTDENGNVIGPAPYDVIAPGLYPDEKAYTLSSGENVAVSLRSDRLTNNGGMAFTVWVRWIKPDGSSKLDDSGQDVEISFRHTADVAQLQEHGDVVIAKELLLAALGEAPETTQTVTIDPLPADAPAGMNLLGEPGTTVELPIVMIEPTMRLNASIKSAIEYARKSGEMDPGSLLE